MQQYDNNYPCGIIMIAMNTKNWDRNVEIFILIIHPRKPEQKEKKRLNYICKFVYDSQYSLQINFITNRCGTNQNEVIMNKPELKLKHKKILTHGLEWHFPQEIG